MNNHNDLIQFEKDCATLTSVNLKYVKAVAEALKFTEEARRHEHTEKQIKTA